MHHLIDEGWIYALRFDNGLVSAGLLLEQSQRPEGVGADELWHGVLERYPTLQAAFAGARPLSPGLRSTHRLQRRRRRAVGAAWAMLPQTYAFFDPLFSTGIAWSLLGVERLADILTATVAPAAGLERYDTLLNLEADQQQALLEAAYAARGDFAIFRELSFLYFAVASFDEIRQRLLDGADETDAAAWRGFLGADETDSRTLFRQAHGRVADVLADGSLTARQRFSDWVAGGIHDRNLVGLGESPTHLYGIDLERLVERSALLGLTPTQMERLLPRLRGRSEEET